MSQENRLGIVDLQEQGTEGRPGTQLQNEVERINTGSKTNFTQEGLEGGEKRIDNTVQLPTVTPRTPLY